MIKRKLRKQSVFGMIWRFFLRLIIFFFVSSIAVTILYKWINPPITPLMVIRTFDQKNTGKELKMDYDWVDIDSISPYVWQAVIAGEDGFFLYHNGFDLAAIEKAREYNKTHSDKRGASTVSQQCAKNVFLWPDRTWVRKGLEVYFTFLIEALWSKERIMEVYLNVIEYGDGIYGVEEASKQYFNVRAKNLSFEQSALLVAGLPNPRKWNIWTSAPQLWSRNSIIQRNMLNIGPQELIKHPYSEVRK
ncbi:MAG: monofunctional biosynthetic peptidoglycan transglycosylase [Bacteroidales bacterium]|nr:monofunctional biosynthetic peptidoglycan transglycosylase [Bacteroidales bacterium]